MNKLFFTFLILLSGLSQAALVDRVVAVVGSEPILESDIRQLQNSIKKRAFIDEALIPEDSAAFYKGNRATLLDYLINEKLIASEVKRLNYSVTQERVEQEIREIAKKNGVTVATVLQSIKAEGLTTAEYQGNLKTQMERQTLYEAEIISKLRFTDEDALAEYNKKNPNSTSTVYEYSLAHIFFNPKKKGGPEAALARAQSVLKKLQDGQNFETLAEQNSEDPQFTNGGILGTFRTGEFTKELEAAVISLSQGQTSGIAKTKKGFHILKLLSKTVSSNSQFEKEKDKIKAQLSQVQFRRQLQIWLSARRDDYFVVIN